MSAFKNNKDSQLVIMLKRKLHNLRFVLFVKYFVDTRKMKKISLLNIKELNAQYVEVKEMYEREVKKPWYEKIIPFIKVKCWKLKNDVKVYDEELWQ